MNAYHTDKEVLIASVRETLTKLNGISVSPSAYDTAWVARIADTQDQTQPMFPQCLEWIINNQLPDGSWGADTLEYYHDRILSTLSCIATLQRWGLAPDKVKRGELYIKNNLNNLAYDAYATVGFELIFPVLLQIAQIFQLDLPYDSPVIAMIEERRTQKLTKIPLEVVYRQPTTILHSLEGLAGWIDFDRILARQAENGSFLNSPSSTAFIYMSTDDPGCLAYIQELVDNFGNFVPVNYPLDIFERLWVLNDIYFLGLEHYFEEEIRLHLNYVLQHWSNHGLPWSTFVQTPDIDDTSVGFKLLRLNGEPVSAKVFESFYDGSKFFCFPGELDSAVSHILNLYEASRMRFDDDEEAILLEAERYCRAYLKRELEKPEVYDKWVIRRNFKHLIEYNLNLDIFYSAPVFERQNNLHLYADILMDAHWIDKTLYYVPNINMEYLYHIALIDNDIFRQNYRDELKLLEAWSEAHPSIMNRRALSNQFIGFNVFPRHEQAAPRLIFSKTTLYLFGADDFFDSNHLTLDEQMILANAIESGDRSLIQTFGQDHEKIKDLLDIIDELIKDVCAIQGRDVSRHLRQVWRENMDANRQEVSDKYQNYIPEFEDYLDYAKVTIGTPLALVVAFYCLAEISDAFATSPEYAEVIDIGARLTRILNDIRTYRRELDEGKVNSIGILMHGGRSMDEAVSYLKDYYASAMRDLQRRLLMAGELKPFYQFVYDLCRTTAWFYQSNDFHEYDAELLSQ